MINYEITHLIHSLIRTNKMVHIIESMFDRGSSGEILIDGLIDQFKDFLRKDDTELFEVHRLKYLTYLDSFKSGAKLLPQISERKDAEVNLILLELYELPKKRNNLFSILLLFYFLIHHKKSKGKVIFKIIHLYFLIIVYRNRWDISMRRDIEHLDIQTLHPIHTHIKKYWDTIKKRYDFAYSQYVIPGGMISILGGIGALCIQQFGLTDLVRADAASALSGHMSNPLNKVAMDSILLGRVTDGIYSNIQSIGLQNILMMVLIAILFQSIRTGFTNLLVNSFFIKIFEFTGTLIKGLARIVVFLYNYIIYILATRYLFIAIQYLLQRSILPSPVVVGVFLSGYVMLYMSVISIYVACIVYMLPWVLPLWQIISIILLVGALLIYANTSGDIQNFRSFLLCIENMLGGGNKDVSKEKDTDPTPKVA